MRYLSGLMDQINQFKRSNAPAKIQQESLTLKMQDINHDQISNITGIWKVMAHTEYTELRILLKPRIVGL